MSLPTRKTEALLAFVALAPGHTVARQRLAALLWGDMPDEQARHNLRQALFALRRAVAGPAGAALVVAANELRIDPRAMTIDVAEFERKLSEPDGLADALALYEGDLLDGLDLDEAAFEEWLSTERARLRERAVDAAGRLLKQRLDADDVPAAIQTALRLVSLDPGQESGHRALMRLYARQGRRTAALRQYQVCAGVLRRELNATPSPETRRLHQEISAVAPAGGASVSAASVGPKSILVVEDEALPRRLLERCLSGAGYEVTTAEDGAAALLALGAHRFDLVLSDIDMPNLDGLALLRVMSQRGIDTPAIFLTAMTGAESEVEGLRLGASDYIRKPIHTEVLLLRVKNALRDGAV